MSSISLSEQMGAMAFVDELRHQQKQVQEQTTAQTQTQRSEVRLIGEMWPMASRLAMALPF